MTQETPQSSSNLAQPDQDYVFSKLATFFNSLKSMVGHIMAKAAALRSRHHSHLFLAVALISK
jgi:hypothetical protein